MTLETAIADTVTAAVHDALNAHTPALTHSTDEAAQLLGVSARTIRRLVTTGHLHALDGCGDRLRITTASIYAHAGWPITPAHLHELPASDDDLYPACTDCPGCPGCNPALRSVS